MLNIYYVDRVDIRVPPGMCVFIYVYMCVFFYVNICMYFYVYSCMGTYVLSIYVPLYLCMTVIMRE